MSPNNSNSRRRAGEAGSAYLAVLLVLVVLTMLGLSLAVVTQTEVLIGGSEKQAVRQVLAVTSGMQMATASEMVAADSAAHKFILQTRNETMLGQPTLIEDDICTSAYIPIHTSICNLCMLNQDSEYAAVQYGVSVTALRRGDTEVAATKTAGSVIAIEPWKRNIVGFQQTAEERLDASTPSAAIDASDPCKDVHLKI
jgi:hypothetical protein